MLCARAYQSFHFQTPHTSKREGNEKVRLVGGGHMFSALSPIWPKCLTSNFASSPQEHTKLLTLHCFQMFSARRQHTDTCERFPPSHTEGKRKVFLGKRDCVRACACLDALVRVRVGLLSFPSVLSYHASVCVLIFFGWLRVKDDSLYYSLVQGHTNSAYMTACAFTSWSAVNT